MKIIRNINYIHLALYLLLLFCVWAIIAIQLKIPYLSINVNWAQERCDNLNQLYINLSYSFLAGFVFYLLTIYFPQKRERERLEPIIRLKVLEIKKELRNVLLEFSRKTDIQNYMEIESARKVLMSKNWTDYMPMYQLLYKANISYIAYIKETGILLKKNINNFIQSYQRYMTTEQICLLEELSSMQIFSIAHQFSQMTISLEDPNGKKSLVDMFIDAINKMSEIEKSFSTKDK